METTQRPFVPPHCPRSRCPFHRSAAGWRYRRHGSFSRLASPHRIPRFRCVHCGATFSSQTFSATYWLRRPDLLLPLARRLLACSGLRQITRELRTSHSTLCRLTARLGRLALLQIAHLRPPPRSPEPLVVDGFESFAHSQYQPLHLNLVVGADSHFIRAFTLAPLRRKGRMTPRQRRRRAALEARHGRPDPKAIQRTMADALRLAAPEPQALTVRSDEHKAYPRAFRRLPHLEIRHEPTPSVLARTPGNPLFPVNLADLLLRHNSANHKRETIAFSKRHQGVIERAALFVLWRNFNKRFSENHDGGTPAMRLGLEARPVPLEQLLTWRLFPSRVALPEPWRTYHLALVDTTGIANPRRHTATLAC